MAKQRFHAAAEIAGDPELAKLLLARAEALLAIEEQANLLKASKADLFDDMREDRLDPAFAKAFVAEKLRDPEKQERARLAAEDRRIVIDALEDAEARQGRGRARARATSVPEDKRPEPATPVATQDEGARTTAQGSADMAGAGSAAARRSNDAADADQLVTEAGAGEVDSTTVDPAPVPDRIKRTPHDHPKRPLIESGMSWRNFRDAYGWPEDEIQARWQGFDGSERNPSAAGAQA